MKATITHNGAAIEIELTKDQEKIVKKASEKITDKIKELQDALDYNGETMDQFQFRTERDTPGQKAGKALEAIAKALRQGKKLGKEGYWYYPYFERVGSGVGLRFGDFGCAYEISYVGSRLCVDTKEKAEYMGRQFLELYAEYLNND